MKRVSILVSFAIVLILGLVLISQRNAALSQRDEDVSAAALATAEVVYTPMPEDEPVTPGAPMGEQPTPSLVVFPTATPLPAAPTPEPALADDQQTLLFSSANPDLTGWEYGQVFPDPAGAPTWFIHEQYNVLVAADHTRSTYPVNDTLALPSATLEGDGSLETRVIANNNTTIGLVLGYQDEQNFVAAIFGTPNAARWPGIAIVEFVGGVPTALAQDTEALIAADEWYDLGFAVQGTTLSATLDDQTVLSATLSAPLAGDQVGLYAGAEGYAFFDYVQTIDN